MKFNRLAFALATACVCGSVTGCLYSHKEEVKEVPVPAVAVPVAPPISSSSTTTTTTKPMTVQSRNKLRPHTLLQNPDGNHVAFSGYILHLVGYISSV